MYNRIVGINKILGRCNTCNVKLKNKTCPNCGWTQRAEKMRVERVKDTLKDLKDQRTHCDSCKRSLEEGVFNKKMKPFKDITNHGKKMRLCEACERLLGNPSRCESCQNDFFRFDDDLCYSCERMKKHFDEYFKNFVFKNFIAVNINEEIICPQCDKSNRSIAIFCDQCGKRLILTCLHCNKKVLVNGRERFHYFEGCKFGQIGEFLDDCLQIFANEIKNKRILFTGYLNLEERWNDDGTENKDWEQFEEIKKKYFDFKKRYVNKISAKFLQPEYDTLDEKLSDEKEIKELFEVILFDPKALSDKKLLQFFGRDQEEIKALKAYDEFRLLK